MNPRGTQSDRITASVSADRPNHGGPSVAPTTRAAGFFDLDNTLVRGASLFHLARGLHAHGFLTGRQILRFGYGQLVYRLRGERAGQLATARSRALSFAAGHTVRELTGICAEIFDEYLGAKIWPGTWALAQAHLDRGEPVWLLTAAPDELAKVIGERLGLTGAMGSVAEQVSGTYTGRLVGRILHGSAKRDAVRAIAAREGYDLVVCHAYSDSVNDLPMLTAVGHPHAVNPDYRLRRHALERGWPVVDYRTSARFLRRGWDQPATVGETDCVPGGASNPVAVGTTGGALRRSGRHQGDPHGSALKR